MQQQHWNIVADLIHVGAWFKNRGIVMLNICLIVPLCVASLNGFDSSVLNGLQIVPDFKRWFNYPNSHEMGLMNSAQNMGALLALPLTPIASDRLGRRKALFIGSCIMLAGVAVQVIANNMQTLIGARAIIGFGLCFTTNAAPLLITELAYPTQRGQITSLYNSSWYLGAIIAAWLTYGTLNHLGGTMWSWRVPSIVQALPCVIQIVFVWFIPESPRWLISRQRDQEAIDILGKYHANGDTRDPLVMFEYTQILSALRMEREIYRQTSYLTLFKTPGNRRRMLIVIGIGLFSQWSGNGLVSFYITLILDGVGIKNPATQAWINGTLQIWNFIVAVSAALLVDKVGRRTLFLISNSGMVVVFAMWTLTTALFQTLGNVVAAKATIPLIFAFFAAYDLAYTPLLVAYCLEILPFEIRARGFAVMNLTVVLTLAFNQFINPYAFEALGWRYYLFYCVWLVFELFFVWHFLVETKGKTLEETAALFDGQEKIDNLQQVASIAAEQSIVAQQEHYPLQNRPRRRSFTLAEKSRDIPSTDDLHSLQNPTHDDLRLQETALAKGELADLGLRPYTPT
ncbi:hypothetical protein EXIGLDRAFT_676929 [Exidia glandulosa HHB12029]|uniref:Major facilitator superfamily (MFS) profile domain-containing protein n=1 Tax=Exidia glandulosa HHB12029 TaxID=1314781 RepID=A0A165GHY5_EXIGL|nr:hypothetical protein EXIGLDRAFT_676929 [Exidia glandulosa HHB12029]